MRAPGCQREYESGCAINSVALHPNQGELISGDRDGNIRVWDLSQNACSAEVRHTQPKATCVVERTSASARARSHWLARPSKRTDTPIARACRTISAALSPLRRDRLPRTPPARPQLVPDGSKAIRCVDVAVDASLLAAANDNGSVFVWRLGTASAEERSTKFEPLQKLQAHSGYITKCLISPDCRRLATTSSDQSVKIWDMASNFRQEKRLHGHQRWVWDAVFSADSAYLVTASSDQTARLWDVAQGETIRHYTGHHKAVICVALHDRTVSE